MKHLPWVVRWAIYIVCGGIVCVFLAGVLTFVVAGIKAGFTGC